MKTRAHLQLNVRSLHPLFSAEVIGPDIVSSLSPSQHVEVQQAIDAHAVLIFRDQAALDDNGQILFSAAFGHVQRSITKHREDLSRRLKRAELSDISNIGRDGRSLPDDDLSRRLQKPARLWHTDSSFHDPPGRYTFLAARMLPPSSGDTEFADMRAAYDALDKGMRQRIDGLTVKHDLARSRALAEAPPLSEQEQLAMPGAVQPLVRVHPRSGRRNLYLASHADHIVGWPENESRALLDELIAFATRPRFIYRHVWRQGDLVMWDNLTTMHRATAFDTRYPRDMRRTTVADAD